MVDFIKLHVMSVDIIVNYRPIVILKCPKAESDHQIICNLNHV